MIDKFLERQIKEDYLILKNAFSDNFRLSKILKVDFIDTTTLINRLNFFEAEHIIELKKEFISEILMILDDAIYKMITPGKLVEAIKLASMLTFLTAVQLKIINTMSKNALGVKRNDYDLDKVEIKDVITEMHYILQRHKEAERYARVITSHLKKYKQLITKKENMINESKKTSLTILPETFDVELNTTIIDIKKQYLNMLDDIPALKDSYSKKYIKSGEVNSKFDFNLPSLRNIISSELAAFCRLRTSLLYIKDQGHDVLSIITTLYKNKRTYSDLLKREHIALENDLKAQNQRQSSIDMLSSGFINIIVEYLSLNFVDPYKIM